MSTITPALSQPTRSDVKHSSFEAQISYLVYDEKHQKEKPYRLQYDPEGVLPKYNTQNELKRVQVRDFRRFQDDQSLQTYGFTSATLSSALKLSEFDDPDKVQDVFYAEAIQTLKSMYPDAVNVEILEYQIRKRHPDFPIATGEPYKNLLPTTVAHIDFTTESARKTGHTAFKTSLERYSHFIAVNLWKSLQGPGNDWPLTLCDRRSIDYATDVIAQDVVFADRFNENTRLYYSPRHEWYYFEDLGEDEAIVFVQMDSGVEGGAGVPHTGFANPRVSEGAAPRVSIEVRAFVFFE